jgi:hypothetical protein
MDRGAIINSPWHGSLSRQIAFLTMEAKTQVRGFLGTHLTFFARRTILMVADHVCGGSSQPARLAPKETLWKRGGANPTACGDDLYGG